MLGYFAALAGAFFVTAKDLTSKKLAFHAPGSLSAFASFAFALPYYLVLLLLLYLFGLEDFAYSSKFFLFVALRSLTDVGAEWLKMSALSLGEISLVGHFFSLSPLFLAVASPLITGDPLSPQLAIALLITTLSSLLLVAKPKSHRLNRADRKAILLALASAFFFSLNSAFDRLAAQEASAPLSAFAMTLLSGAILLPIVWLKHRQDGISVLYAQRHNFFLRGLFEVAFMVLKLFALKQLQAPVVIIIQRFSLFFTIIAGRLLYQEKDFKLRLIAGCLILLSGALILF